MHFKEQFDMQHPQDLLWNRVKMALFVCAIWLTHTVLYSTLRTTCENLNFRLIVIDTLKTYAPRCIYIASMTTG